MTNLLILLCFSSLVSIPSSSQPTQFTYAGFRQIGPNVTLSGSSQILKNGVLKLTNDSSKLMGHAFYTSPLRFKSSPNGSVFSFSTCFAFVIVPEYQTLGGHGLAFALSPSRDLSSALPSHYLGLFNDSDVGNSSNHLFAVEFDTIQNVELGDINDNHIGIDINSLKSNESAVAAYYTTDMKKQELNLKGGKPILVWIDYDSVSTQINVTISPSNLKPRLPIISYKYDLSTLLHESMYVGFSASTGLLASSHYILGWSFKMNGIAESLSFNSLPSLPGPEKRQTTLIIGVSVSSSLFLIAAILGGVYVFWKIKNRDVIEDWELELGPHRFSYQELKQATRGFKDSELLGVGGFGRVYKGTLPNSNAQVAVKRISHDSRQGLREFLSEIASIGRLRHRNLVQLLGWCRRRGDFGLARLYDHGANPGTTRLVGTFGYLAPELPKTGKASTKSDVFAFGALLLEVVCGRRPVEPKAAPEELVLVDWVRDTWKEGSVVGLVDPKLEGEFDDFEVVMVLKLGLMCSNDVPMVRPSMRQVVRYLEGEILLPDDLSPLLEGNGSGGGGRGVGGEGFDGYENSFLFSSSFEKGSYSSFRRGDVDASFGSISTSPISLLDTGDAR
ncbi:L-type lectin-domain containing receptor kinase S.4-like isoform X2 [Rhododendron vialii]|uniref:L-type lectin-domain containing receptor kinase S.4-like isoform X2 n=1 Tax=Rhododendron vialii TaxID=182163 RepID=UPI00265DEDCC|nr:L-type lectin-domain containing receptor kinase S.4-like isoform X2 [Rhododendron vialii]